MTAITAPGAVIGQASHHVVPATAESVHWGYFSFQLVLHKRQSLAGTVLAELDYPLLETPDEWVVHGFSFPNYLDALGETAQSEIFAKSSLDGAMRDAFRKMRHFLMTAKELSEDEAISLMSVAVDFGVTQVVDGNWGVHAILKKALFAGAAI